MIGQNFVYLTHSERGNFLKIIFRLFYSHYGPKLEEIWMKIVFKMT
jgi:hypothetical protein